MALEFAGTFILTDDSLDRHSERVLPSGVMLDNFKKNAIMYYNHHKSYSYGDAASAEKMPVGVWRNVKYNKDANNITGDAFVDVSDDLGSKLLSKVSLGVINAVSIGFDAIDYSDDEANKLKGQRGLTFTKTDLIEASLVDIPSNKNALKVNKAFKKSISEGQKENLHFIKSFGRVNNNIQTTTNMFTDKIKSWLVALGINAENAEQLEQEIETKSVQHIAKGLFDANNSTIITTVSDLMAKSIGEVKTEATEAKEASDLIIKGLRDKVEELAGKVIAGKVAEKTPTPTNVINKGASTPEAKALAEQIEKGIQDELDARVKEIQSKRKK